MSRVIDDSGVLTTENTQVIRIWDTEYEFLD
jgi:hypothetical protein